MAVEIDDRMIDCHLYVLGPFLILQEDQHLSVLQFGRCLDQRSIVGVPDHGGRIFLCQPFHFPVTVHFHTHHTGRQTIRYVLFKPAIQHEALADIAGQLADGSTVQQDRCGGIARIDAADVHPLCLFRRLLVTSRPFAHDDRRSRCVGLDAKGAFDPSADHFGPAAVHHVEHPGGIGLCLSCHTAAHHECISALDAGD